MWHPITVFYIFLIFFLTGLISVTGNGNYT